jgi:hypothetical protein
MLDSPIDQPLGSDRDVPIQHNNEVNMSASPVFPPLHGMTSHIVDWGGVGSEVGRSVDYRNARPLRNRPGGRRISRKNGIGQQPASRGVLESVLDEGFTQELAHAFAR